jgi:cell cycle checkpoint protein
LWTDAFAATTSAELAVHAKKVAAVRTWIAQATSIAAVNQFTMRPRVLGLTGPPGCGKSATVRVLARDLNLDLHEWHAAPVVRKLNASRLDPEFNDVDDQLLAPLARWLDQHASFRPLLAAQNAAKLLLIDELPYLHSERERASFRAIIDRFCRSARFPLVIVLTDSVALRTRNLLPTYDNDSVPLAIIAFNATPPTLMRKALLRVLARAAIADVADSIVDHVTEQCQGDVRHAVNTLQMLCVGLRRLPRATAMAPPPSRPNKRKKTPLADRHGNGASSSANAATANSAMTSGAGGCNTSAGDAFVLTVGRDETVSLFRALGNVLMGKREDSNGANETKSRPMSVTFLDGNSRRRSRNADGRPPLVFDPEELLLATNMDANMFALFLFENYVPYFDSVRDEERSIESVAGAADWLSLSAQVGAVWDSEAHGDIAHQYAGSLAVRGIVHENWFPDPASAPAARSAFRPQHRPHWLQVRATQQVCAAALRVASLSPAAVPLAPPRSVIANAEVALDRVPWLHRIVAYMLSGAPTMRNSLNVPSNVRALCRAVCNYVPAARNARATALQQNELAETSDDAEDEKPSGTERDVAGSDEAMRVFEQWAGLARRRTEDDDAETPMSAEEVRQQIELLKLDPIVD